MKLHTKIAVLAFDQPSLYVSQGEQDYQETKKISIPDHPDENIHSVLHGSGHVVCARIVPRVAVLAPLAPQTDRFAP